MKMRPCPICLLPATVYTAWNDELMCNNSSCKFRKTKKWYQFHYSGAFVMGYNDYASTSMTMVYPYFQVPELWNEKVVIDYYMDNTEENVIHLKSIINRYKLLKAFL